MTTKTLALLLLSYLIIGCGGAHISAYGKTNSQDNQQIKFLNDTFYLNKPISEIIKIESCSQESSAPSDKRYKSFTSQVRNNVKKIFCTDNGKFSQAIYVYYSPDTNSELVNVKSKLDYLFGNNSKVDDNLTIWEVRSQHYKYNISLRKEIYNDTPICSLNIFKLK